MSEPRLIDEEIDMIKSLARETRARHIAERIYMRQTDILERALRAIDESGDLNEVIAAVLRENAEALSANALSFWRHDLEANELVLQMMFGYGKFCDDEMLHEFGIPRKIEVSRSDTWPELEQNLEPIPVYDIEADTRVTHKAQILAHGIQTMLIVPLLSNKKLIGWSSAFHFARREYDADYIRFAQALAQQATFVVELIRLAERGRAMAKIVLRQEHDLLTTREAEVLALLAKHKSDREIGATLHIAPSTATSHVTEVRKKLGAKKRDQAVDIARAKGLLDQL